MPAQLIGGLIAVRDAELGHLRSLQDLLTGDAVTVQSESSARHVRLPDALRTVLQRATRELGRGNAVTIASYAQELTTQEAADLLNVSRPFLIDNILEAGLVPFRRVGTHRRVRRSDLLAYLAEHGRAMGAPPERSDHGGLYYVA